MWSELCTFLLPSSPQVSILRPELCFFVCICQYPRVLLSWQMLKHSASDLNFGLFLCLCFSWHWSMQYTSEIQSRSKSWYFWTELPAHGPVWFSSEASRMSPPSLQWEVSYTVGKQVGLGVKIVLNSDVGKVRIKNGERKSRSILVNAFCWNTV